jgi:hypothetical protein
MTPRVRDALVAMVLACVLAVALTWPLAAHLGSAGRIDSGDGRHGVWNVAWVAHSLTTAPSTVFDANIFYPHDNALAFSEANLVAGVLGIPVWLFAGGNPYATFNAVVLMAFMLAGLCAFLLARTVGAGRGGAAVAGVIYGCSPFMLAHLPHIQLLMTFGPALSLAMLHRFVSQPTTRRALALGLALAVTGLACAYYGIFSGLIVSIGVLWFAGTDGHWRSPAYWVRAALAAGIVLLIILPFFLPYLGMREEGFARSLDEARLFSTVGPAYLASAVHVHKWMLPLLGEWREVLFPGFQAILLSVFLVAVTLRSRRTANVRIVGFYVVMMVFAFWISLGPDAGLYTALYHALPAFSFLRAPARMGLLITLGTAILAGLAITSLSARFRRHSVAIITLSLTLAIVESWAGPITYADAPQVGPVYRRLAAMPRTSVAEFPFYQGSDERHRQTEYMLMSTFHWQPLLNGYSDHFPQDYLTAKPTLALFPAPEAITLLREKQVRWVVVHFSRYPPAARQALRKRLRGMDTDLRLVIDRSGASLYEVIASRPPGASRQR